ncbi:MAG TPA: MFS transporter [Nitrospira sp.]|nr:MFS transporter [Nitrospira sp.]
MEDRLTRVIKDVSTHSRQHHRHHHIKPRWLLSDGFAYVWWGQVVSQVGDGISKLALLWFVYSVTGSPLKTSIIGILQTAPAIVLAPLIGVAVDRLPKKALLITSDLVRAVVIGLIPCWMSVDSFTVSSLYVLVTLHAVATAVFGPALTAAVPSLVTPSQYTSANALLQITTSLGIILGPALSGLGIAALSSQEVLCLNALTYVISAACFVPIRFAPPVLSLVSRSPILSTWRDMVDGVHYVLTGRRVVIFLTITASLYTFATSAFTTLFPVFARTLLDLGPVEVGYLWSMLGVGLLTVSVALTVISAWSIKRRVKVIAFSSTMSGVVLLALVQTNHPTSAAVLLVTLGAGLGVLTPVAWGVLQEVAPSHMLGRVLAFYTLGAMAAAMAGITVFGWVTGEFGVPAAVVAIGLVMGGTGLSAWRYLNFMSDRPPKRDAPFVRDQA